MSIETQPLDLAQRIAEALSRTDQPGAPAFKENKDVETIPLGETPFHLKHLVILLNELEEEMSAAQKNFDAAKEKFDAVTADTDSAAGLILSMRWLYENTEYDLNTAINSCEIVYSLFFNSLVNHLPQIKEHERICVCDDWLVHGEVTKNEGVIVESV